MYKYVLFDLDGTLTDPKEGICKSVQYALHKMNIEEPDIDKLEPFIGPSLKYSFTTFYGMSDEDALKAVEYYRERFSVVGLYENIPYEGIDKLLAGLKFNGVKLAVASAKPQVFVEKIMEHFGLARYFDAVVGSELDGTRSEKSEIITEALLQLFYGKDHEEKTLDNCGDFKAHTVMVGDRFYDVDGAKAIGIDSIAVEYGYAQKGELKKSGATYVVKTVAALDRLLQQKAGRDPEGREDNKEKDNKQKENKEAENKKNGEKKAPGSFFKAIHVLVPFVLYYLVMMATVSVCTIVYGELQKSSSEGIVQFISDHSWVFSGGVTGLSTLMAGAVMILTYKKTDHVNIKLKGDLVFSGLAGIFLAVGLNMLFVYILRAFPALAQAGEQTNSAELPIVFGILIYIFISPVSEEILFRYLIYGRVKKWMGPGIAIFASALFFGLYHAVVIQSIYAFLMGIAMGILYELTDNFFMPLIFHIMANAVVYSLRYVPYELTAFSMGPFICGFSILIGVAMVLTVYKNSIKTSLQ